MDPSRKFPAATSLHLRQAALRTTKGDDDELKVTPCCDDYLIDCLAAKKKKPPKGGAAVGLQGGAWRGAYLFGIRQSEVLVLVIRVHNVWASLLQYSGNW